MTPTTSDVREVHEDSAGKPGGSSGSLSSTILDQADELNWLLEAVPVLLCGLLLVLGWLAPLVGLGGWWLHVGASIAGGLPTAWLTLSSLLARRLDVDLLMLLAAVGAGTVGHVDEAATLLFLFTLSNLLETFALGRTRRAIRSLMKLRPDVASVERDGEVITMPVGDIAVGQILVARPGERIALDGAVDSGEAEVDESALTGEAVPRWKGPGEKVLAGSINLTGLLRIRTTRTAGQSTLARMVELVEQARGSKAHTQRLLDRFIAAYVVGVLVAVTLTAVVPPLLFGADWADLFYRAMTLLVVASPCALVISTPATILSAIGAAARRGILFKGGAAVEALARAEVVAFDKTGTLTDGVLSVMAVLPADGETESDVLSLAAAAEYDSEHPLARAVVVEAERRGLSIPRAETFRTTAGLGVEATVNGRAVVLGNVRFLESHGVRSNSASLPPSEQQGKSVWLAVDGQVAGRILLADRLRPEASRAIENLRRLGVREVVMLTGDEPGMAEAVGKQAGVDSVRAGLLPQEKVEALQQLAHGRREVVMVGDGVNDGPALVSAAVGVAMGAAGTDLAIESADVVLMASDLNRLVDAVAIGRWGRRILLQNLTFASAVIVVLAGIALTGLLPLSVGVVGHEGSTLVVVANGLRLLAYSGTFSHPSKH